MARQAKGKQYKQSRPTLVEVLGGPTRIVQHVVTGPKTITVCPVCKGPFKEQDSTILVDLVKRIALTQGDHGDRELTVRIHLCGRCAEPIVRQKREAMDQVLSLFTELLAERVVKEMEQERRTESASRERKTRQAKPGSRDR